MICADPPGARSATPARKAGFSKATASDCEEPGWGPRSPCVQHASAGLVASLSKSSDIYCDLPLAGNNGGR